MARIALIYAAVASLWIALSDQILSTLVTDPGRQLWLGTLKGWFFVGMSSLLIYSLVKFNERQLRREEAIRGRTEVALQDTDAQIRWMGDNLPDSYLFQYTLDPDGNPRFLHIGAAAEKVHQVSPADALRDAGLLYGQMGEDYRAAFAAGERDSCERMADMNFSFVFNRPDGQARWLQIRSRPRRAIDGRVIWDGLATDVTAAKAAEDALRESEARLRGLLMMLPDAMYVNTDNAITFINQNCLSLWRAERPEQILGKSPFDLVHPDDHARLRDRIRNLVEPGKMAPLWECRMVALDGTVVPVEATAVLLSEGGKRIIQVVVRDISARKAAEDARRELEAKFLRSQRLEAIGTLAGGVAHDLNNILAPVLMISGLLKGRLAAPEDQQAVEMLEVSARRGAAITRQLLTFSRGASGEKIVLQPLHLLREMTALMKETFPREITIEEKVDPRLWTVEGDPTQLHQVLMNLCVNARDAMPRGGRLLLSAKNVELSEHDAGQHPGAKAGNYAQIAICDDGVGISEENLSRIFDPFFTTKPIGQGTGLGLSTVLGIVQSHGGFLNVSSEPGRGAVFSVHLPASSPAGGNETDVAKDAPRRGHGELVLVVDDESAVSASIRLLLERNNYRVLTAENGREALVAFVGHHDSIRLVLTDTMMPVMGGAVLIQSLRTIRPDLRIIVMTGQLLPNQRAELEQLGVTDIALKPCQPDQLLHLIRRKLDR